MVFWNLVESMRPNYRPNSKEASGREAAQGKTGHKMPIKSGQIVLAK
jgi:hypothetical protein